MPLEVIYVVRHGFRPAWTVDPRTGVYSSSVRTPTGIPTDPPLSAHGVRQSVELARRLMTLDPPIDVVYSSPAYRCLQTLTPYIEERRQLDTSAATKILPEKGIGEWHGTAHFEHPETAAAEVLNSEFPAYCADYVSIREPLRNGETIPQLYERVASTLRAIVERCDADGTRAILLCTHASVCITLGRVLTGNIPDDPSTEDFTAFTCGLSAYRRRRTRGGTKLQREKALSQSMAPAAAQTVLGDWSCELNGDCSFLTHGAERGWKFNGDEAFPGAQSLSQTESPKL